MGLLMAGIYVVVAAAFYVFCVATAQNEPERVTLRLVKNEVAETSHDERRAA